MDLREALEGDPTHSRRQEPAMPGIIDRVNQVVFGHWRATTGPTETHRRQYEVAAAAFTEVYDDLRQLIEADVPALEERLEAAGAPCTPGRGLSEWEPGGRQGSTDTASVSPDSPRPRIRSFPLAVGR